MISVVMPVWNRSTVVGRAIESVLGQSYKDFELIIIDDGSHDSIDDVVRPFLSERVKYYRIEHRGVSAARNLGVQRATGELVAYLDSDNVWHSDFLAQMEDALSSVDYDAAYCLARRFVRAQNGEIVEDGVLGREFCFKELLENNYIDLNTFVHTRRIFDLKGGFDEKLRRLNDWDMIIRIAAWGEIKCVPAILVDYYHQVEENAISLVEDHESAKKAILARYSKIPEPITYEHDTIKYTWERIPDRKYRNYWIRLQPGAINPLDYKAYGQPVVIQIEPTNICNLQCPLCPVAQKTLKRESRHMRFEEFKKIIDDVQDHVLLLILWDWGEPLTNPELPRMIRYAADRDIRTVTSTNAHFLDNDTQVEELLSSGLSTLIVAIDSIHADIYQKYRKEGSLEKALSGLHKVIEIKKKTGSATTINFRMVVMRQNEHEVAEMERMARKIGADVFSVKTLNPACGEVGLDSEFVPEYPQYQRLEYRPGTWERVPVDRECERPWIMANIYSDGSVVPCCYDFDAAMKVGNAFEEPFAKIWNGPAFVEMRKNILTDRNNLFHCTRCLINYKHTPQGMFYRSVDFRDLKNRQRNVVSETFVRLLRPMRRMAGWLRGSLRQIRDSIRHISSASSATGPAPAPQLASHVYQLHIPLPEDGETSWKPYPIFSGSAAGVRSLASHVSALTKGHCPHPPHTHRGRNPDAPGR
ncbi:MAG TPA: glycosyltransferase [Thermodesulfovibrionales bacterium]|nr:glycosyltransferase [Thermodesulfovibrionales bacterium]